MINLFNSKNVILLGCCKPIVLIILVKLPPELSLCEASFRGYVGDEITLLEPRIDM